jgi:hypothetical protein
MKACAALLGAILLGSTLSADANPFASTNRPTITTRDGITYERCKLTRVDPDGINFIHSKGIAKIRFAELPDSYQHLFKYDPEKAAAFKRESKRKKVAYRNRLKRSKQKAEIEYTQRQVKKAEGEAVAAIQSNGVQMRGQVSQVTEDGVFLRGATTVVLRARKIEHKGFIPLGSKFGTVTEAVGYRAAPKYENVFIVGDGSDMFDGQQWSGTVYPAGVYRYETVLGAGKNVQRFALTPQTALAMLLAGD